MPSSGNPSTKVCSRRSPSQDVRTSPPESRPVAVLSCCTTRSPLPHELSARTPTTSTAYRSAELCPGQRPEMPCPHAPILLICRCECDTSNAQGDITNPSYSMSRYGQPDDLVFRRYERFGAGGAKLIWGEATAVLDEGRANPRQLLINDQTALGLGKMLQICRQAHRRIHGADDDLLVGLQLTHSGR